MIDEKRWDKEMEAPIIESWAKEKRFEFNKNTNKKIYSIDTPPPYINAPIHIGHATTYAMMDMFARFKRMTGFEVIFPLGLDRNGIPIEIATEKRFKIKLTETSRHEFIEMAKKMLDETGIESTSTFFRSGISFSSWEFGTDIGKAYMTDSDEYRALTQATFIDMWNRGMIYEAERINNWCPGCKTTLADSEIVYNDKPSKFNDIKFKVKETGKEIIIGTTRPELIATCGMIIFNPEDDRYKDLDGKTAITPIFEKEISIKAHPMADIEKGTGLVMMCSAGDVSDIQFFREQKLEPVIAIDADGRMNENAGLLSGLTVTEGRAKIIEILKEKDLVVKSENITHRTPTCERSGDDLEFISMKEFYFKQVEYKNELRKIIDRINFVHPPSKQMLLDWVNSVSTDWPISRRRYYGTEIPIWHCKECGKEFLPEPGEYYRPWKDNPPDGKCSCGSIRFNGETRILDTWFDSSISPFYILGYNKDKDFFFNSMPATLRPQGKDIVRTWLYYSILRGYLITEKPIFDNVWIHHHILDSKGKKMSKSKGNVVDPQEALEKYGAETFRLWTVTVGDLVQGDILCSMEKIESNTKTLVKLWNVARFISQFKSITKPKRTALDNWILKEINDITKYTKERYEKYDFHTPALKLRHFLWETFASHYLELVKPRVYNKDEKFSKNEQAGAIQTLNDVLDLVLKLLHPIIPIITFKLYNDLRGKEIDKEEFPKFEEIESKIDTNVLMELNGNIWKHKKDSGLSLKDKLDSMIIPESLKPLEEDLKATHNIKEMRYE